MNRIKITPGKGQPFFAEESEVLPERWQRQFPEPDRYLRNYLVSRIPQCGSRERETGNAEEHVGMVYFKEWQNEVWEEGEITATVDGVKYECIAEPDETPASPVPERTLNEVLLMICMAIRSGHKSPQVAANEIEQLLIHAE